MYKCKCPLLSLSLLPPQRGLQQLRAARGLVACGGEVSAPSRPRRSRCDTITCSSETQPLVPEGAFANGGKPSWQRDQLQRPAVAKGVVADHGKRRGQGDCRQRTAIPEAARPDDCEPGAQPDRREVGTAPEAVVHEVDDPVGHLRPKCALELLTVGQPSGGRKRTTSPPDSQTWIGSCTIVQFREKLNRAFFILRRCYRERGVVNKTPGGTRPTAV
eukprot:scaffold3161_cov118-Isochrysis_galbana.AAC.19